MEYHTRMIFLHISLNKTARKAPLKVNNHCLDLPQGQKHGASNKNRVHDLVVIDRRDKDANCYSTTKTWNQFLDVSQVYLASLISFFFFFFNF